MGPGFILLLLLAATVRGQFDSHLGNQADPSPTQLVDVTLTPFAEAVAPGQTVWMGLRFDIEPGWHIYWRHPGDSGLPTRVAWDLPAGWSAGEIRWPAPERFEMAGGLTNIGYGEQVMLLVPITAASDAAPDHTANLVATVRYLVCDDARCLAAEPMTLKTAMPITRETRSANEAELRTWRAKVPRPVDVRDAETLEPVKITPLGRTGRIVVDGAEHRPVSLFLDPEDDYETTTTPIRDSGGLRGWSYRVRPFGEVDFAGRTLHAVVVWEDVSSRQKSIAVELPLGERR